LLPLGAFDLQRVSLTGTADRDAVEYAPGEVMTFTIKADLGGQEPPAGYAIVWERSGDDGN